MTVLYLKIAKNKQLEENVSRDIKISNFLRQYFNHPISIIFLDFDLRAMVISRHDISKTIVEC